MDLKDLKNTSIRFTKMQSDDFLFNELNALDHFRIAEVSEIYKPKDRIQPVNLLRFLVSQLLLNKKLIKSQTISEIKNAIENRDVSKYYKLSGTLQNKLSAYKKSNKGMFPQWTMNFRVLYPFFWSQNDNKAAESCLINLGQSIIDKFDIPSAHVHAVGFSGPQNYGATYAWGAIIPKGIENVQLAYQLFFKIDHDGFEAYIEKGHKVKGEDTANPNTKLKTWDEVENTIQRLSTKWITLNANAEKSFQEDEFAFLQRIRKINTQDLLAFFNIIDKASDSYNLISLENLTFSIASGQISFQVGNRYCLVLKGNRFSFISTSKLNIKGKKEVPFSDPNNAWLQQDFTKDEIGPYIDDNIEAVGLEIERGTDSSWSSNNDNAAFRKAAFDKKYRNLLINSEKPQIQARIAMSSSHALNTILFGPPGTGKTFHTINHAVKIIDPIFMNNNPSREAIKQRYEALAKEGHICFTTFHQSMSYEDFIEGIKPKIEDPSNSSLGYEITSGIFKSLCNRARKLRTYKVDVDWDNPTYFKMSLGGMERPEYHDWCIENGVIGLGWGKDFDITPLKDINDWSTYKKAFEKQFGNKEIHSSYVLQSTFWLLQMKEGDIVVASRGNRIIDAIGIVKGPYFNHDYSDVEYRHFRKVDWIATNLNTSPDRFFKKQISQMTLYRFKDEDIRKEAFRNLTRLQKTSDQPYVMIIDEINRGNVSQIFGELITLIETDKRQNAKEELEVILPYSKERFGVPDNVYIIGTMNTADRSVEALDTALRRRFNFVEKKPDYELPGLQYEVADYSLAEILRKLNRRIEKLLDKDHQLGHSYLLEVGESIEALKSVFKNKFIPLLQEYFFGDYARLGLVLGEKFFMPSVDDGNLFASFRNVDTSDFINRPVYQLCDLDLMSDEEFEEAIQTMMSGQ